MGFTCVKTPQKSHAHFVYFLQYSFWDQCDRYHGSWYGANHIFDPF